MFRWKNPVIRDRENSISNTICICTHTIPVRTGKTIIWSKSEQRGKGKHGRLARGWVGVCDGVDCGVKIKVTPAVSYLCVYFVCAWSGGSIGSSARKIQPDTIRHCNVVGSIFWFGNIRNDCNINLKLL